MRLINMNELRDLRYTILKGMKCIGRGTFASVYANPQRPESVVKVTTDWLAYCFITDQLWQSERAPAARHFAAVMEDHRDVGTSMDCTTYAAEVESLVKVTSPLHRKYIKQLIAEWEEFCERLDGVAYGNQHEKRHALSIEFCEKKFEQGGQYHEVFEALLYFFSNYGGQWDLKPSNFMQRKGTGDLVFNDVVMDGEKYSIRKRSNRCHA